MQFELRSMNMIMASRLSQVRRGRWWLQFQPHGINPAARCVFPIPRPHSLTPAPRATAAAANRLDFSR